MIGDRPHISKCTILKGAIERVTLLLNHIAGNFPNLQPEQSEISSVFKESNTLVKTKSIKETLTHVRNKNAKDKKR